MKFYQAEEEINAIAEEFIAGMKEVEASLLHIDYRASSRFYVSEEGIAVHSSRLGNVEYYGGFEYEKEYKTTLGEYVFWSSDSGRIAGHLANLPEFAYLNEEIEE